VRGALKSTGTLIPNNGRGGRWVGPLRRIVTARVRSLFTGQSLRPFLSMDKRHDLLLALSELIEAKRLTPVTDRTSPCTTVRRSRAQPRKGRRHRGGASAPTASCARAA
jgi:hypothetical protein